MDFRRAKVISGDNSNSANKTLLAASPEDNRKPVTRGWKCSHPSASELAQLTESSSIRTRAAKTPSPSTGLYFTVVATLMPIPAPVIAGCVIVLNNCIAL